MTTTTQEATVASYELEVRIDAPRADVWRALTEETNAWWLPDFHMVGAESVVTLDARAGGHLVEHHGDGGGLLWYTVHMCVPGESLHLVGHVFPEWGGPAVTMLRLALAEEEGGTVLRVTDTRHGSTAGSDLESSRDGWRWLFTDGLKAHLES